MQSFTDRKGRAWDLVIDVNAIRKVRSRLTLDLYSLTDNSAAGLSALLEDPVRLVDTLWVLCEDQAKHLGVSDEDFGRSFDGDVLESAATAFVEELVSFFPSRAREGLKKLLAKGKEVQEEMRKIGLEAIDQVDAASLARKLSGPSGSSPDSSELSPVPGPSEGS